MSGPSHNQTTTRPPTSAPQCRSAAGGLFTGTAAPAAGGRTPRASRAAASAATTAPRLQTLPTFTPVGTAGARVRSAVTPLPGSAQLASAQLVRTPGTVRAQAKLARGAGWRSSLMKGDDEAARKLAERREMVRGPAVAALEELLMVGRDNGAEDNGVWKVGDAAQVAVSAFQSMKTAFLSNKDFLDPSSLANVAPHEIVSPTSPLNTLAQLSNLTTFLNLVLSSAPDDSGVANRTAVTNLKTACDALLRHVKPEEEPVDEQIIKLVVDLKCQAFILASSASRTPLDPAPYFSQTLGQLLPAARAHAMTDRAAAAKFQTLQSAAVADIASTGGDWAVLRTKWRWEDLAREARDWVDRCVQESGLAVRSSARADDDADAAFEPVFGGDDDEQEEDELAPRPNSKGKERAVEEVSSEDSAGSEQVDSEEDELEESLVEQVVVEEDVDSEEEVEIRQFTKEESVMVAETALEGDAETDSPFVSSSDEDDDEIARGLGVSVSPMFARSMSRTTQMQVALAPAGAPQSADAPLAAQDSLPESQLTMRAESLLALGSLGHAGSFVAEDSLVSVNQHSDRVDEFFDMLNESRAPEGDGDAADDDQTEEGTPRPAPTKQDDVARLAAQQTTVQQVQAQPAQLRFDANNRLYLGQAAVKPQRSLLERQPDARKISFDDSQSQPASPGSRSAASHRVPTPETARVAHESLPSPEPTSGPSELFRPDAGPSGEALQQVAMEPDLHQDFGGGFDEDQSDLDAQDIDGAAIAGFDDDQHTLLAPDKAFSGQKRAKKDKGKARAVEPGEEPLPTTAVTSIEERLRAFEASQPANHARNGSNAEAEVERRKGKSARPAQARNPSPRLSSPSAGDSSDSSDVSINLPRHMQQKATQAIRQRKKRAVSVRDESEDSEDSDKPTAPPRKKQSQGARPRSPSPPEPSGAPGNLYFQGRNAPGERIPWSTAETDLLIELLKRFDCDWARMMKLHGPSGTVSLTFRNRTNVSLKDKAVNLALGYLRRGAPLPDHFKHVTIPKSKLPKVAPERPRANETDDESE